MFRWKEGLNLSRYSLELDITIKDLVKLATAGAGSIIGQGLFKARGLSLVTSSAGVIVLELEAETLVSEISSTGSLNLGGKAESHLATLSSTSHLHAYGLETGDYDLKIISTGSAYISASRSINAALYSTGSLYYRGEPHITAKTTSTGRVLKSR